MSSPFTYMRLMVFFDLPVTEKEQRRLATQFRQFLLKDGFIMMQWSVYSRLCRSWEVAEKHKRRVRFASPKEGSVRMLVLTERQYTKMEIVAGKPSKMEKNHVARQLLLF